jgi:hypothetical protein
MPYQQFCSFFAKAAVALPIPEDPPIIATFILNAVSIIDLFFYSRTVFFFRLPKYFHSFDKASGLNEMLSIPSSTKKLCEFRNVTGCLNTIRLYFISLGCMDRFPD